MKFRNHLCRGFLNVAILCVAGSLSGWAQQPTPAAVRVACVGDSITAGYGLQKGEKSYPNCLRELLGTGFKVQGFGVSGSTFLNAGDKPYTKTQDLGRATQSAPNIVVIALGTNDSKLKNFEKVAGLPKDATEMIHLFRDLPSKPTVFLALPAPVYRTNYGIIEENLVRIRALLAETAKSEKVPVIDLSTALANHAEWFPDGVHPNGDGAAALAKAVASALQTPVKP